MVPECRDLFGVCTVLNDSVTSYRLTLVSRKAELLHIVAGLAINDKCNVLLLCFQIHSSSTRPGTKEFLENNIRVKPDLDALGALGDLGWYCIEAVLWAKDNQLPTTATALPDITKNSAGVILSFTASIQWEPLDHTVATIHCSFLSHTSMDLSISASNGTMRCNDYIIPYAENSASFEFTSGAKFAELHIGWSVSPEEVRVVSQLPQEALMVQELSRLAKGIKEFGHHPDRKWPDISRNTQLVLDAVKKSIDLGCKPVNL